MAAMKLLLIACEALRPEIEFCMARSPHTIDIVWVEQGLHNTPEKLHSRLQDILRSADSGSDAVLLGYGLCGNGLLGLSCSLPLVVPKAHDCITLLLGSKQRHEEYNQLNPGSYFFSAGWIEHSQMPGPQSDRQLRAEYIAKYGPDNADYLMEVEQEWRKRYKKAVFIDWNLPNKQQHLQFTRQSADYLGWEFDQIDGDPELLQRFLDGRWDDQQVAVLPAGQPITQDLIGPCKLELQP